ncbi:MAG: EAL domain-containing protein [Gammaproteobacteria bacterium]|nr:EAL domain-containing protein [Gammaproteobacteria bacterium]
MTKNGAPPAGFLSLKWKALLLTSIVLIGVTAAYTWLNALLLNEHFGHRRAAIQESYARQLQALLDRSSKRLEQLGTVFASSSDVQELVRSPTDERAAAAFERLWTNLTIDMEVETVGLFSHQGFPIATRGWDRAGGSAAVGAMVPAVSRDERPRALYDCSSICLQFTAVPVLGTGGQAGALVLGVSPADAVLDFQQVSGTDMGLVAIGPATAEDAALPARYIPHWQGRVVALSNERHNIPLLRAAAARYPDPAELATPRYEHVGDQVFELRMVPLAGKAETGRSYVVAIADVTEALREIRETTRQNIIIGLCGLVVAESLLLAVLWGPLSRLRRAAGNLPLLAQAFAELRSAIRFRPHRHFWRDEVDVLNETAVTLSSQLEALHGELQARVEELGIERDFVTSMLETGHVIILTQTCQGVIRTANRHARGLSGYSGEELEGKPFAGLLVGDDTVHEPLGHFVELVSGQRQHLEEERDLRSKDGAILKVVWHHSILKAQGEPLILSVGMDITARKSAELRLTWLADHDPLTHLFNRRRLQEELEEAIARAKRYRHSGALVIVDLDQFKYVNDTSGHPAGDRLLEGLGESLPRVLREVDVIARLGGDEFAIVLGKADEAEAVQVAKKILAHIQEIEVRAGHRVHRVSASLGITLFPQHGDSVQDLLAHADLALYEAKESGRSRCHLFSPEDQGHRAMQERVLWKERVERALVEKRFVLAVQPIVHIRTQRVSHYEVLLRMRHDDGSLISPAQFIEVAERVGLIGRIDRMVVAEAVRAQARLAAMGEDVSFAVNLSAHAFNDPELLTFLADLLRDTGVDPKRLILEMTETATVADFGAARSLMEAIRGLGCSFALDDFGRGFASFFYLKELPMEFVKIDGSFVRNLLERPDDQALVRAMAQIARAFGKKTVAEHVESGEVLELLAQFDIDYAQGYYTGRPVPMSVAFPALTDACIPFPKRLAT